MHSFGMYKDVESFYRLMPDGTVTLKLQGVVDNCEVIEQVSQAQGFLKIGFNISLNRKTKQLE